MPVGDGGNRSGYDQVKSPAPPEVDHSACDDNGCAAYDPPPEDADASTANTAPESPSGASPPVPPELEGDADGEAEGDGDPDGSGVACAVAPAAGSTVTSATNCRLAVSFRVGTSMPRAHPGSFGVVSTHAGYRTIRSRRPHPAPYAERNAA